MTLASCAKDACKSFCALLNSSSPSSRLTRAKLRSSSERSLSVASAPTWSRKVCRVATVCSATRTTACACCAAKKPPSTASRICSRVAWALLASAMARSLALPARLGVRPKSVMSWERVNPSALRS